METCPRLSVASLHAEEEAGACGGKSKALREPPHACVSAWLGGCGEGTLPQAAAMP